MKFHLDLTGKLAFILFLFGLTLVGVLSTLAYTSGQSDLQNAVKAELISTVLEKQSALENWLIEAKTDITAKANSPAVIEYVTTLLATTPGSPESLVVHNRLKGEFQPIIGQKSIFLNMSFIKAENGEVLVATDPQDEGKFLESQPFFIHGKREPFVSEVYSYPSLEKIIITTAAPIIGEDENLLGVIAGQLDLNNLGLPITRHSGLYTSEESYLVNSAGLLITQPRFASDSVILKKAIVNEAIKDCLAGNNGVLLYNNYRDHAVIGAYRWLPTYMICLVSEIDQAEAFATSHDFGRTVLWTSGLALIIVVLFTFFFVHYFSSPINEYERKVNELNALNKIAGIVLTSIDAQEICNRALDESLVLVNVKAGVLYRIDSDSGDMVVTAHRGLSDGFIHAVGRLKPGEGFAWRAANSGKPVIMADVSEYTGPLRPFLEKEAIQSSVVIPLIGRSGIVGAMNLAAMQSRTFDKAKVELLIVIGQQIAIGLEKAKLNEELQSELAERKIAEEALKNSEHLKSELLEKLNETQHVAMIGSWEWDLATNNVWWSDETYRIFGVTPKDFIPNFEANGKFIHPDDLIKYNDSFEHSFKTGEPLDIDVRLIANNGLLKHCNGKGGIFYDESGQPIRFVGTMMDITERKRMELLQETLYTISQAAITNENLHDFYQSIH